MEKNKILNFLTKYHLGGLVEETIWNIEDKRLTVNFRSDDKSVMGTGMLSNIELENSEFGVHSTSKMINAISPLDSEMKVELLKEQETYTNLIFSDNDVINKRTLTSTEIIDNTFKGLSMDEDVFDTEINIDSTFLNKFNKIKNLETENIGIKINNDNTATFILNYSENNVDTGKFNIPIEKGEMTIQPVLFKFDVISKILSVNKEFDKGKIKYCNEHGILKFQFIVGDIGILYYTVALQ